MSLGKADRRSIEAWCGKNHVRYLALFGSRATGANRPESDVDILIEFAPGKAPGLFAMARLAEELSSIFDGAAVDLRTPRDLAILSR